MAHQTGERGMIELRKAKRKVHEKKTIAYFSKIKQI
jgi:hypothetical protein